MIPGLSVMDVNHTSGEQSVAVSEPPVGKVAHLTAPFQMGSVAIGSEPRTIISEAVANPLLGQLTRHSAPEPLSVLTS